MWQDLVLVIALVLVIEGISPALSPASFRRGLLMVAQMSDRVLRRIGLAAMTGGALLIYLIKG
ncbi:DUF2065 domain-containing protein [Thiohalophilus sp.]|uniref:DUF2065 domain-containing protein n=1 Tax=Thiohalophilus sp. TaxID=3028392 RepID=UPI002ACDA842|nr:DUF2065 domain-containing protein [Thiohalophilus sp.]MDZ7662456.1 DUF2065 domain-containing protein [Thiohalophilus sp.]